MSQSKALTRQRITATRDILRAQFNAPQAPVAAMPLGLCAFTEARAAWFLLNPINDVVKKY